MTDLTAEDRAALLAASMACAHARAAMWRAYRKVAAAIGHDHPAVKRLLVEGLEVYRVGQELEGMVLG
ncbi:hypothetical protein IM763_09560 [Atopobiaceae bacterium FL090493]|nr:hypothetical protein [Atopobiaceae bacterium FL090493]